MPSSSTATGQVLAKSCPIPQAKCSEVAHGGNAVRGRVGKTGHCLFGNFDSCSKRDEGCRPWALRAHAPAQQSQVEMPVCGLLPSAIAMWPRSPGQGHAEQVQDLALGRPDSGLQPLVHPAPRAPAPSPGGQVRAAQSQCSWFLSSCSQGMWHRSHCSIQSKAFCSFISP